MKRLKALLVNRRGAALAEYGLIAAIVGAGIAVASLALGSAVSNAIATPPVAPPAASVR